MTLVGDDSPIVVDPSQGLPGGDEGEGGVGISGLPGGDESDGGVGLPGGDGSTGGDESFSEPSQQDGVTSFDDSANRTQVCNEAAVKSVVR